MSKSELRLVQAFTSPRTLKDASRKVGTFLPARHHEDGGTFILYMTGRVVFPIVLVEVNGQTK